MYAFISKYSLINIHVTHVVLIQSLHLKVKIHHKTKCTVHCALLVIFDCEISNYKLKQLSP